MDFSNKKIVIFGAGSLAKKVIKKCKEDNLKISYIVDNDKYKIGGLVEGIEIKDPNSLRINDDNFVIIASSFSVEIQSQLKQLGLKYGRDYVNFNKLYPYIENTQMKFAGKFDELTHLGNLIKYSIDEVGVVLKNQDYIYRAIYKESEVKTNRILEVLNNNNFYNGKVISTKKTNLQTKNFPLILEHPFINPCTDVRSWSYSMIKDALKTIYDLLLELREDNLTLKDSHALNFTFYENKFILVDFGSINYGEMSVNTLKELVESFVFPIILFINGKSDEYYKYNNYGQIPFLMVESLLDSTIKGVFEKIYVTKTNNQFNGNILSILSEIMEWLNNKLSNYKVDQESIWSEYQDLDTNENFTPKQILVLKLLKEIKGSTLIDIAGNSGFYCVKASEDFNYKGVLTDFDYRCIDKAYNYFNKENINFIPIVNDFNGFPQNLSFISQSSKFDVVLCLAFLHHLVFSNGFTFNKVRDVLLEITKKDLIIEFVDQGDEYVSQWINPYFGWYNMDSFEKDFSDKFNIISKENIAESRYIYHMVRK